MSRPEIDSAATTTPHTAAQGRRIVVALLMTAGLAGLLAWMLWLAWPLEHRLSEHHRATLPAQPAPVSAVGAAPLQGVPCASYAPFRRSGHTPFDATLRITPEQIRDDLRVLATVTRCVRTYGVDQGIDAVPMVARELGLQVVLGAWIGREAARNEAELSRALALAREYRDVVRLLVVGNEVLLRGEQTPQAMAALLARARTESPVPTTYADVWEFWLRHADALRGHVDVVTVHILPYWEDEPVGIDAAVAHVRAVTARVRKRFGAQPLFIGETGWPAEGRQRGPARPGVVEQTRFVRELLAVQSGLPPLNIIEAFDQPWKRKLEGAVGGAWGLLDAEGQPRVTLAGPVHRPAWKNSVLIAALGGAVLGGMVAAAVAGLTAARRRARWRTCPGAGRSAALVIVAAASAAAAVWQVHLMAAISRSGTEWLMTGAASLAGLAACVVALHALHTHRHTAALRWAAAALMVVFLLLLWHLAFSGRYRMLLWPLPFVGAWALALACTLQAPSATQGQGATQANTGAGWLRGMVTALGLMGGACAGAVLWHEGPHNAQAGWLAASWLALLVSAWHAAAPHRPPEAVATGP